jgi:ubiquinol-cytochrome c reductase cytochrome c1 subunit
MVRVIAFFVGIGFAGVLLISLITGISETIASPAEPTAEEEFHRHPKHLALASDGPFGRFDRQQLQRGFQVYKEVCAACHGLSLVAFRDLHALGYEEPEIKAIANQWATEVPSLNPDTGEPATRKAIPSDHFPSPYANETAARAANNNALPPDLSLITKAREGGAAYIYSLLTGYQRQPARLLKEFPAAKTPPGLHYNPYFANLNLAMPPPLTSAGQVTYAEGNPAPSVDQMAKDVSAFLVWTAEPKLESRHRAGIAVVIFLLVGTVLAFLAYRQIWAEAKRKVRAIGPLDPKNRAKTRRAKAKAGTAS